MTGCERMVPKKSKIPNIQGPSNVFSAGRCSAPLLQTQSGTTLGHLPTTNKDKEALGVRSTLGQELMPHNLWFARHNHTHSQRMCYGHNPTQSSAAHVPARNHCRIQCALCTWMSTRRLVQTLLAWRSALLAPWMLVQAASVRPVLDWLSFGPTLYHHLPCPLSHWPYHQKPEVRRLLEIPKKCRPTLPSEASFGGKS